MITVLHGNCLEKLREFEPESFDAGSGSTGKAARLEGFGFVGIEREAEYVEIARARVASA